MTLSEFYMEKYAWVPTTLMSRIGTGAALGAGTGAITAGEGTRMQGALKGGLLGGATGFGVHKWVTPKTTTAGSALLSAKPLAMPRVAAGDVAGVQGLL